MAEAIARHSMPLARKHKRGVYLKVGIAAAAACALLAGGAGTFAAWNDSTTISGGSVSTGKLDINAATGVTGKWYDLTSHYTTNTDGSVTDLGSSPTGLTYGDLTATSAPAGVTDVSSFDGTDYVFAPGDVVEYATEVTIDAQGTNLQASLVPSFTDQGTPTSPESAILTGGAIGASSNFNASWSLDWADATAASGAFTSSGTGTITYTSPDGTAVEVTSGSTPTYSISTNAKGDSITVPVTVVLQLKPTNGSVHNGSQNNGAGANQTAASDLDLSSIVLNLNQTLPGTTSS